jgi:outer membrane lipoprotein carrier protein
MGKGLRLYMFRVCFSWLLLIVPIVSDAEDVEFSKEDTSAHWIKYLHENLKKIFSIQGDFTQDIQCGSKPVEPEFKWSSELPRNSERQGIFKVKRPGMYRWEYTVPSGVTMVSDGKSLFVYDKADSRVIVGDNDDLFFIAISQLFTDDADEFFFVETLGVSNESEQNGAIQFTPKEPNPYIRFVVITISKNSPFLKRILVVDKTGCIIRMSFQNIEINKGIKNSVFRFNAPKNSSVTEP